MKRKLESSEYIFSHITGANRVNQRNAENLFCGDGISLHIFRLTMSRISFKYMLMHTGFDNKTTRQQRVQFEKLCANQENY